jgi:membrane protease YdiL (CAAX protease family)
MAYVVGTAVFGSDVMLRMSDSANYTEPVVLRALKIFQLLSQMGIFIFPVVIFALFASDKPLAYLNLNSKSKILPFLLSILAILLALPLINWLAEVNSHMHLPSALNGIEEWMKKSETEAAGLTNSFLLSNTWPGFLVNILMMAIIPALGEELLFRGLLIRLFREWTKDVHVAIFISAFIFSAIHMQFYGFFARLMMGVMFGYLLYWTGSIWVPILVHFINNAIIVSFGFAYVRGLTQLNPDSVGSTNNIFVLIGAGILLTIVLLILYRVRHIESPDTSKG